MTRTVTLTPWEYKACVDLATARMSVSIEKGIKDITPTERDYNERLLKDISGACGELAVAKAINRYWAPSVNTFHNKPDIEPNIEVRSTARAENCLIVRDNDPEDRYYFLVIGEPPTFQILGYMKGSDAKRDEWRRNPHGHRPAWFVPQEALTPIKEGK